MVEAMRVAGLSGVDPVAGRLRGAPDSKNADSGERQ